MLKNTFYYGEFEYPVGSGNWYQGAHEPIISKMIFDRVQEKLMVPPKVKYGNKGFSFTNIFKCAYCGSTFIGEDKHKLLKNGTRRTYRYYHCNKFKDSNCPEPYIEESELIEQLLSYIKFLEKRNKLSIKVSRGLKIKMQKFASIRDSIHEKQKIAPTSLSFVEYATHALNNGTIEDKQEVIRSLGEILYIHNKSIYSHPLM